MTDSHYGNNERRATTKIMDHRASLRTRWSLFLCIWIVGLSHVPNECRSKTIFYAREANKKNIKVACLWLLLTNKKQTPSRLCRWRSEVYVRCSLPSKFGLTRTHITHSFDVHSRTGSKRKINKFPFVSPLRPGTIFNPPGKCEFFSLQKLQKSFDKVKIEIA